MPNLAPSIFKDGLKLPKRGEISIGWMEGSGHKIHIFLNRGKDRWRLYCECPECDGTIVKSAKSFFVQKKLTKLLTKT